MLEIRLTAVRGACSLVQRRQLCSDALPVGGHQGFVLHPEHGWAPAGELSIAAGAAQMRGPGTAGRGRNYMQLSSWVRRRAGMCNCMHMGSEVVGWRGRRALLLEQLHCKSSGPTCITMTWSAGKASSQAVSWAV